jgi:hypothetical protein
MKFEKIYKGRKDNAVFEKKSSIILEDYSSS